MLIPESRSQRLREVRELDLSHSAAKWRLQIRKAGGPPAGVCAGPHCFPVRSHQDAEGALEREMAY